MKITNYIPRLPFVKSNGTMKKEDIKYLIVHHEGVKTPLFYDTYKRTLTDARVHVAKGWGHISYHYVIDNVGDIFQCLPETEVGYHAGNLDVNNHSIAVCVQGNYEVQNFTPRQQKALRELCTYLFTARPDLPNLVWEGLKGHNEVREGGTACPGKNIKNVIKSW